MDLQVLACRVTIIEWFGLAGTFKDHVVHIPCHGQGWCSPDQVAQSPGQLDLEHFQWWVATTSLDSLFQPCKKFRWMTSVAFPLSTDAIISLWKATKLVRHDVLFLSLSSSLSSMCFDVSSKGMFHDFTGCGVRLVVASSQDPPFFTFFQNESGVFLFPVTGDLPYC